MNRLLALLGLGFATLACAAQPAPAEAPQAAPAVQPGEPNVRHIVVEDQGSRIEELRVRGTTQRIVVRPKVGTTQSYEILTGDGGRNLTDNADSTRGATGKRVWNVLNF